VSVEVHDLEVVSDFLIDGWTPVCSCDWEGPTFHTSAEAVAAWEMHCDAVFEETTS
jgi:hypothetical protein